MDEGLNIVIPKLLRRIERNPKQVSHFLLTAWANAPSAVNCHLNDGASGLCIIHCPASMTWMDSSSCRYEYKQLIGLPKDLMETQVFSRKVEHIH